MTGQEMIMFGVAGMKPIMPAYIELHNVTGYRETPIPTSYRGRADGYGNAIPCRAWLELETRTPRGLPVQRWHRVYAICWGTGTTLYIRAGGRKLFLETGDMVEILCRTGINHGQPPILRPIRRVG